MGEETFFLSFPMVVTPVPDTMTHTEQKLLKNASFLMGSPKISKPSSKVVHVNNLQILVASQSSYEKTTDIYLWALAAWRDLKVEYLILKHANDWLML